MIWNGFILVSSYDGCEVFIMNRKQYMKVIESIVKSPRNDLQKIVMLQDGFGTYLRDHEEHEARIMNVGDIVKHFKWETISEEERKQNKYLYCIRDIAEHTETGEEMMIYQALYAPFKTYAIPLDMFLERVDRSKYPDIKQRYRFEKHNFQF